MPSEIDSILKDWEVYYLARRPLDKEFLRERIALKYPLEDLLKRRDKALELMKFDFNMLMNANGKVKYIDYEDDNVKIYYKKELTFENFVDMNPFSTASKIIKAIVEKKKERWLLLSLCEDKVRKSFIDNSKRYIFDKLSSDLQILEYSYDSEWRSLRELTHYKKLLEQEENEHFKIFWDRLRKDILDEIEIFTLRFLPFFFGNSVVNKHIIDLISFYLDSTWKSIIRKRFSAHILNIFIQYDLLDKFRKTKELRIKILNEERIKKMKEKEEARLLKVRKEEEARAMKDFKAAELQPALLSLALDKQNIHTGAVNVKANQAMDSILKTVVSESCGIFKLISLLNRVWCTFLANNSIIFVSVLIDIKRHAENIFYINEMGETVQELRYQRLLCCVVQKIENNFENKNELYIRLWEECVDSVGMCFQGHMSRLCNVFSGFDPDFTLVASRGEQIQAAFQDLSTKKISFVEKKKEAFKIFEKFLIQDEETKNAWIEVLDTDEAN